MTSEEKIVLVEVIIFGEVKVAIREAGAISIPLSKVATMHKIDKILFILINCWLVAVFELCFLLFHECFDAVFILLLPEISSLSDTKSGYSISKYRNS